MRSVSPPLQIFGLLCWGTPRDSEALLTGLTSNASAFCPRPPPSPLSVLGPSELHLDDDSVPAGRRRLSSVRSPRWCWKAGSRRLREASSERRKFALRSSRILFSGGMGEEDGGSYDVVIFLDGKFCRCACYISTSEDQNQKGRRGIFRQRKFSGIDLGSCSPIRGKLNNYFKTSPQYCISVRYITRSMQESILPDGDGPGGIQQPFVSKRSTNPKDSVRYDQRTRPDGVFQGFHGAGGGGGVGNIGGTAEKIVFLSIPLASPDKAINAATRPAFPARVGSV